MRGALLILFIFVYCLLDAQTIVSWDFGDSNATADGGLAQNSSVTLSNDASGTTSYPTGASGTITNPPYTLNSNWSSTGRWEFTMNTEGYSGLSLNFKQRSSGTGPRDWRIEVNGTTVNSYSLGSLTTGQTFGPISLGSGADNNTSVTVSFIVNSNTSVNNNTIQPTGTNGLDDIIVTGSILPIKFASFNANMTNLGTKLNFTTASEVNNDYFSIERSSNGVKFESIGQVKGAGNANNLTFYDFLDDNPYRGINYYRVQQVDYDGSISYSQIVQVYNVQHGFSIRPLASENLFDVTSTVDEYELQVINTMGQQLRTQKVKGNEQSLDLSELMSGIYFVTFTANGVRETIKISKL